MTTLSAKLQNKRNELDNYAHLISHELKSSLRNVSDLLTWSEEEQEESKNLKGSNMQLIREKTERMETLLVKIEQYQNITTASFKDSIINIHTIAEQVIDNINKPPHITIRIVNELPTLFADKKMLEKVFEILIQNAVEHIDKKVGIIELSCETTEEDYVFSIKDNGVGIHEKYYEKIFTLFQALESTKSTGIGLNIVEKIIANYEGKIQVKSIPGEETIFYFNLPKTSTFA